MKRVDLLSRTTLARAAAELTLIVAGILIALAVDGALADRADRAAARESLELVRDDMQLLVEQVEEFRVYNEGQLAAGARLSRTLGADSPIPRTAQTWEDLDDITSRRTLRLPRAAWDELVGTGNLRLLEDAELRRDLVRFYETVARDQEIIARNNAQFSDGLGVGILVGEGLVLRHRRDDQDSPLASIRRGDELMGDAGIGKGPTFRGRIWALPPGHTDRIRAEAVVLSISLVAASSVAIAEGILVDAEALLERIDLALAE